jgi:hypothetical protein
MVMVAASTTTAPSPLLIPHFKLILQNMSVVSTTKASSQSPIQSSLTTLHLSAVAAFETTASVPLQVPPSLAIRQHTVAASPTALAAP